MKIIITGASSQIGDYLIPKLLDAGHQCYLVSRSPRQSKAGMQWVQGDLEGDLDFFAAHQPLDAWIHIPPLLMVDTWIEKAAQAGIKRIIGFSTTSIYTKKNSSNTEESNFILDILAAEKHIKSFCESSQIDWAVFRPTLIYGCGRDNNVAFIDKMVHRFGFFPVVGDANGKRQPVHADDLADACLAVLSSKQPVNKAYNLSGGEILTYREMVERIFRAQNKPPRILKLPVPLLKLAVRILAILPAYRHVNPAMVDRINQDMNFDHDEASSDLGYSPRCFLQQTNKG